MGDLNSTFPPHMVASQLKILIPVGTAIAIVDNTKKVLALELIPTVNMVSQTRSGIFPRHIPGQRMHKMVAMMLIAVPILPNPETKRPNVQKSVLCPGENVWEVKGA